MVRRGQSCRLLDWTAPRCLQIFGFDIHRKIIYVD